uniref:hypothetical protein n=1 Tax=Parasutterella excrementihominis TaxID=487175 RepID=UPI003FF0AE43
MEKSKKLQRLENEVSALGYRLVRQYVVKDKNGNTFDSFPTLTAVEQWVGKEESRQLGDAGGDAE